MRFKTLAALAAVLVFVLLAGWLRPGVRLLQDLPGGGRPLEGAQPPLDATPPPSGDGWLLQAYNALASDFIALKQAYDRLNEEHSALQTLYEGLKAKCEGLQWLNASLCTPRQANFTEYEELKTKYCDLANRYDMLWAKYVNLVEAYRMLSPNYTAIGEPCPDDGLLLQNPQLMLEMLRKYRFAVEGQMFCWKTPTLGELKAWLESDDTDEKKYSMGTFNCWDFAIMLKVRAKMAGWCMGIVFIEGYRIDDPSKIVDNSTTPPIGEYLYTIHAINAIMLADGRVAYIEPQSDMVFFDIADYVKRSFGENFVFLRTIGGAPISEEPCPH